MTILISYFYVLLYLYIYIQKKKFDNYILESFVCCRVKKIVWIVYAYFVTKIVYLIQTILVIFY